MLLDLYYRQYGERSSQRPPLILLHGLFGSSSNWHGIARRLEEGYQVITPDLRNHGRSPHTDTMDYPSMAGDLVRLMDKLEAARAILIGHSMGAKVAMWLALSQPRRVARMMAVDMAPVSYPNRFGPVFSSLDALDLDALESRAEAETILVRQLRDLAVVRYLLQNLALHRGHYRWRMNLPLLEQDIDLLLGFPQPPGGQQYPGPAEFLYGSRSDYLQPQHQPIIKRMFPQARLRRITGAGHWVYAEKPQQFLDITREFLEDPDLTNS